MTNVVVGRGWMDGWIGDKINEWRRIDGWDRWVEWMSRKMETE